MDWEDIDKILFDGTKEQIKNVKCVECNNAIGYEFNEEYNTFTVRCKSCGLVTKSCKVDYKPNCVIFYGNKSILDFS